jgi:hypothetical protein
VRRPVGGAAASADAGDVESSVGAAAVSFRCSPVLAWSGAPAAREPARVRVRRVVVGSAEAVSRSVVAEPAEAVAPSVPRAAATGSGAWNSTAGAGERRDDRVVREDNSGASRSGAANGESTGGAAFFVDRRDVFLAGASSVVLASTGVGPASDADAVVAAFCAAVLRVVDFFAAAFFAGCAVGAADSAGSVPAVVGLAVFFVARFRAVFAGAVPSVVPSVLRSVVTCSFSSMGGAPVVPRAPIVGTTRGLLSRSPVGGTAGESLWVGRTISWTPGAIRRADASEIGAIKR